MAIDNKTTMLKMVREGREALEKMLAKFDETQMGESHPPDGWSIKDTLAHITFWESYALERLRDAARGEKPRLYGDLSDPELNRINQEALEAGRANTLDRVKDEFHRVHRELYAELEAMPEDQSSEWWTVWPELDVPWKIIGYNTYDHYEEHLAELSRWVK